MVKSKKIQNVLVVDDDPTQVKLLETNLTQQGYQVSATTEASEGLQMAMDQLPDLIILDVMMPVINGFNFCRLLKSEEKYKYISIILLTSRDELEDVKIGMEMGADAYLTKPVNFEELYKAVEVIASMKN